MAFSPDSQYLASLGAANDGFLYVWRINERNGAATLFASNKCTSNVTQIAWMGNKLVTIGTRHVKIWRVEQSNPSTPARQNDLLQSLTTPDHRTLLGRNCVLGDLLEATFTTIVPLDSARAILCSDKGTVCLLTDFDGHQRFVKLRDVPFAVTAAILSPENQILIAGDQGELQSMNIENLEHGSKASSKTHFKPRAPFPLAEVSRSSQMDPTVAFVALQDLIATLDCRGVIRLMRLGTAKEQSPSWACVYKLPAHGGPVLGVRALDENNGPQASFFTWTGDGTVMFWDAEGRCKMTITIDIEQLASEDGIPNELKVAKYWSSRNCIITGDKYGIMR